MWRSGYYGYLSDYLLWCVLLGSVWAHTWCFFKVWPADHRRRARLVLGNIIVTICMLGTIAFGLETYLRFVSVSTDAIGATSP